MSNDSREAYLPDVEQVPNTLGGFRAVFYAFNKRSPTDQEVWDAAVRSAKQRYGAAQSQHESDRETLVRQCADAVMKVYVNPTPEELGVMYDCRDAVLKAPNRYIRQEQHDKRIARGDDFAGDAWLDKESNEIVYGVVGHDMNGKSALLSDSGSQENPATPDGGLLPQPDGSTTMDWIDSNDKKRGSQE